MKLSIAWYRFLLVGVLGIYIFSSSVFLMLPAVVSNQQSQSAFATFPAENGKIAFSSQRDGIEEVYVMNADGTGQTRLTNNPDIMDYWPRWSPNGTKMVFNRVVEGGDHEIYVMNADC